ncbi:conserved hypothetical protein [Histoplasma capsulatum var. duboisii H88]|nr:conserved hypothetical protein [Histoplasma capsulatum H143]EGC46598.1 conserved hypothetical protein [Histoplasma capsulatum var. duboisii H88]
MPPYISSGESRNTAQLLSRYQDAGPISRGSKTASLLPWSSGLLGYAKLSAISGESCLRYQPVYYFTNSITFKLCTPHPSKSSHPEVKSTKGCQIVVVLSHQSGMIS